MTQHTDTVDTHTTTVGRTSGLRKHSKLHARAGGRLAIGGDLEVHRIGFGTRRLVGDERSGGLEDRDQAIRTLRKARNLGVNLLETADSYGPNLAEQLIREALHPYHDLVITTRGGNVGQGSTPVGRPEYLRQAVSLSLERLGLEQIHLWQLHRVDPKVPRDEQYDAMKQLQDEGLVRHLGLREATIDDIEAASRAFEVASVQNRYNLSDRHSEEVVDYCEDHDIAFIAWQPLAAGDLAREGSILDGVAGEVEATPGQVALAWLLKRSPAIVAVPSGRQLRHLRENVGAGSVDLSDADFQAIDRVGRQAWEERRRERGGQPPTSG